MKHRFTIKELEDMTAKQILLITVNDRLSELDGVSPLSVSLRHIRRMIETNENLDQKTGYGEKFF